MAVITVLLPPVIVHALMAEVPGVTSKVVLTGWKGAGTGSMR